MMVWNGVGVHFVSLVIRDRGRPKVPVPPRRYGRLRTLGTSVHRLGALGTRERVCVCVL